MNYIIGEKYWFANHKAGRNTQSSGVLINWENEILAVLYSDRWGFCYATKDNLDNHNGD